MSEKKKPEGIDSLRFCVGGLFVIALVVFLTSSRAVLLPVILSLILMLITRPFYGLLHRWLKLPNALASFLIVMGAAGTLATGGYFLADPATKYMEELGNKDVQEKLKRVFSPIQKIHSDIVKAAEKVDKITVKPVEEPEDEEEDKEGGKEDEEGKKPEKKAESKTAKEPGSEEEIAEIPLVEPKIKEAVSVKIKEDSVGAFYVAMKDFGFYALSTLVLLFFLLAYGEEMSKRMGQARGTPELLLEIEREVSGYLFTITAINTALGVAIGTSLWLLGVPNPLLWGVMAALLNFIPYAGALIGAAVVTLVSAMEFQTPGMTFAGGAIYLGLSTLEGNLITPLLIGRRFEINPIIVFVWVLIWSAIWGLAGMLIGLPLLIILRVVCSRVPSMARLERIITIKT